MPIISTDQKVVMIQACQGGQRIETYQSPLALVMSLTNTSMVSGGVYGGPEHKAALKAIAKHIRHVEKTIKEHEGE